MFIPPTINPILSMVFYILVIIIHADAPAGSLS